MPEPPNLPMPPRPPTPPPARPPGGEAGSFALGYAGSGVVMLLVAAASVALAVKLDFVPAMFLIPALAYALLLVFGYRHGVRTGKGVLAMLLTLVGLVILLVAACFGYVAIFGFNMH